MFGSNFIQDSIKRSRCASQSFHRSTHVDLLEHSRHSEPPNLFCVAMVPHQILQINGVCLY